MQKKTAEFGAIILGMVAIVVVPIVVLMFSAYVLTFLALMFVLMFMLWAVGVKFEITESGKKIGHVRWFTFYREEVK